MEKNKKKTQIKNLLYFFGAGLFLVLIIFNAVKVESLEGFLKFFSLSGEEKVTEIEEEPVIEGDFTLTGCNLRECAGDRFDNYSINYGILARLIMDEFSADKDYNDCNEYLRLMETNGFITWKQGDYLNEVLSREEAVKILKNVYNSLKAEDDPAFSYELSHPQISASKKWTEDLIQEISQKIIQK